MSSPVIIVTGASKGLGLAAVRILLERYGASVVAVSRSVPEPLKQLEETYSGRVKLVTGDVSDPSTSSRAVFTAISSFSRLTGLILNAGTLDPMSRFETMPSPTSTWTDAFAVNVFSVVEMLKVATPALRENRGRIVVVSSGASTGKTAAWGCYNATKAAVNSICRTYANEEKDIAIFAIRPGVVDTEMQQELIRKGKEHMDPDEFAHFVAMHKGKKLLSPEDPGHVLAKLAVEGPLERSGEYLSWDCDDLAGYRRA